MNEWHFCKYCFWKAVTHTFTQHALMVSLVILQKAEKYLFISRFLSSSATWWLKTLIKVHSDYETVNARFRNESDYAKAKTLFCLSCLCMSQSVFAEGLGRLFLSKQSFCWWFEDKWLEKSTSRLREALSPLWCGASVCFFPPPSSGSNNRGPQVFQLSPSDGLHIHFLDKPMICM